LDMGRVVTIQTLVVLTYPLQFRLRTIKSDCIQVRLNRS